MAMRSPVLLATAVSMLLALAAIGYVHHQHRVAMMQIVQVPTFYGMQQLALKDAPYRLAGYTVPGQNSRPAGSSYNPSGAGPQRLEGMPPPATHSWPPSPPAPVASQAAAVQQLGYLTEGVDPAWVAAGETPFDYYEQQSPIKERELSYWPGIKLEDVIPDEYEARGPVQGTDGWVKGSGYGLYVKDGKPVIKHGFMAKTCDADDSCQNTDICVNQRCVPAIFNGTAVAESQAQLKLDKAKKQQLMFNMVYEHHEMPPMAFGSGGVGHDDGSLPPIDSDAKAGMQAAGQGLAGDKTGIWYDPYSGYGNDGLAAKDMQLAQQVQELKAIAAQQGEEMARLSALGRERMQLGQMRRQQVSLAAQQGERRSGVMQQLAMGGGTPLDLSFGVGKDGEPPYHMNTVAESVRNGILDPNAPEGLPYATVKGSGTTNKIATVGYMSPLPGADEIDGTVA